MSDRLPYGSMWHQSYETDKMIIPRDNWYLDGDSDTCTCIFLHHNTKRFASRPSTPSITSTADAATTIIPTWTGDVIIHRATSGFRVSRASSQADDQLKTMSSSTSFTTHRRKGQDRLPVNSLSLPEHHGWRSVMSESNMCWESDHSKSGIYSSHEVRFALGVTIDTKLVKYSDMIDL